MLVRVLCGTLCSWVGVKIQQIGLTSAIRTVVAFCFFTLVLLAEREQRQTLRSCVGIFVLGLCVSTAPDNVSEPNGCFMHVFFLLSVPDVVYFLFSCSLPAGYLQVNPGSGSVSAMPSEQPLHS